MQSSITSIRHQARPVALLSFARSTTAIESGFIAAGITASAVAAVGSLAILLNWIFFG